MDKRELKFWQCVDFGIGDDCWLWTGTKTDAGYGTVVFKGERTTAHRIAYKLTKGEIPNGLVLMHKCDNRPCCNPAHLKPGTQKQNLADMHAKGRQGDCRNFGGKNGNTRITFEKCEEMRRLHNEQNITQTALAKMFGLGQSHVSRIIRHENRSVL